MNGGEGHDWVTECPEGHALAGPNLGSRNRCLACRRDAYAARKRGQRAPGLYYGIPAVEYHAGLTKPRPLSSTLAKNLLRLLPEEAAWYLGHDETTPAFSLGAAVHELLLEGELKTIIELPHESWRTKAAQEDRDAAIIAGLRPMLSHELDEARDMVAAVRSNPLANRLLSGGKAEVSALAELMSGCPTQARYDYLNLDGDDGAFGKTGWIVDVKTVAGSAHPHSFYRPAANYGYHVQAALYTQVAQLVLRRTLPFYWLVVSKKPPYACSVIRASDADLLAGDFAVNLAAEQWRDVLRDGWPTSSEIHESALPNWIHGDSEIELELGV